MRYVVARRIGRRGEGLGNEMMAWAKGAIASEVLGARLVGPGWGLNKRRYYRNFGTSRLDWVAEELLTRMPHAAFTEADYRASGEIEFGRAVRWWAERRGLMTKQNFVVSVDGMYGGYPAIRTARSFLLAKLLNSREALRHMREVQAGLDPRKLFVAVHMRSTAGGHEVVGEGESVRGRFNIVVPGGWYLRVCEALRERFGEAVQFYVFTDKGGAEYEEVVRRFNPGQVRQKGLTECSDLLLMAEADLRVCSVSSYSLMASFLSGGPYVWYEPQLHLERGMYNIWGGEGFERVADSLSQEGMRAVERMEPDAAGAASFRGYVMGAEDGLPNGLAEQMAARLRGKDGRMNLLEYGSVPVWTRTVR